MNHQVNYSTCKDVVNPTGVYDTSFVKTFNSNTCYKAYAETNKATIKSSIAAHQECVGGTQIPELPGRDEITVFPRATYLSRITAVTVAVRPLERI